MKNEPAFPTEIGAQFNKHGYKPVSGVISGGLTKREYFAGQALFAHLWLNRNVKCPDPKLAEMIAMDAVTCADALIAELEKNNG